MTQTNQELQLNDARIELIVAIVLAHLDKFYTPQGPATGVFDALAHNLASTIREERHHNFAQYIRDYQYRSST